MQRDLFVSDQNWTLPLSRRALLGAGAMSLSSALSKQSFAKELSPLGPGEIESHGLSTFGELGEPADFKYFSYVNPDAPKGGVLALSPASPTYDTFNAYVLRGNPATGMSLVFDTLMNQSLDERDAYYGLVAKNVRISADRLTYRFHLRKEARFHDGSPLTAQDVAFSLNILKTKGHPVISQSLRDLVSAEAQSDDLLIVKLAPGRSRDLPLTIVGQPIFSRKYYANRDFEATTLDPPLGSGPYKIGEFEQGRYIAYQRVKDYWA
ncbi:MAG: ABC transporter substrate-binding protein, partial [Methylocystaceae bacterium]|nr:ABC transporter substrate-binding protein [Methylocystaceae bacterium]